MGFIACPWYPVVSLQATDLIALDVMFISHDIAIIFPSGLNSFSVVFAQYRSKMYYRIITARLHSSLLAVGCCALVCLFTFFLPLDIMKADYHVSAR